jgi:hypothetical protein
MIISPLVGAFVSKYFLWLKVLGGILLAIFLYWAWGHYIAEPLRAEGRAEVQAKWDKRERELALRHAENINAARATERTRGASLIRELNIYIKGKQDENEALAVSLDTERRRTKQLRTITGTISPGTSGVPGANGGANSVDRTCRAKLPPEIREGFERLREISLRVGNEANQAAIKLNTAQGIIEADRK